MTTKLPQTYNTKAIHKWFTSDLKEKKKKVEKLIKDYQIVLKNVDSELDSIKGQFGKYCYTPYSKVIGLRRKKQIEALRFRPIPFSMAVVVKPEAIKLKLNTRIDVLDQLKEVNKELDKINKKLISFKIYKAICNKFNLKIVDAIIKKAYVFHLASSRMYYGAISIKKKRRHPNKLPVNWDASLEIREGLIRDGITPYKKDTAPNGTKWLVRFTDEFGYYWRWSKYSCTLKNKDYYCFTPCGGVYSIIGKLHAHRRANPSIEDKYSE